MLTQKKRLNYLDFAKAVAIILVGVGHYKCDELLKCWIYMFHIPLLFIVSGITFNAHKYSFKVFLKRKLLTLILPWIVGVFIWGIFNISCGMIGISATKVSIVQLFEKIILNIRPGLLEPVYWFLPCLFLTEIILFFVLRKISGLKQETVWLVFIVVIMVLYHYFIKVLLPWEIDILPTSLTFCTIGFILNKYILPRTMNLERHIRILISAALMIVGTVLGAINKWMTGEKVSIYNGRYGIIVIMILSACLISFSIILIGAFVNSKIILFIGKNSLLFYILQPVAYKIVDIILVLLLNRLIKYNYSFEDKVVDCILLHLVTTAFIGGVVIVWLKIKGYFKKVILTGNEREKESD